jgi:hypothetical protein
MKLASNLLPFLFMQLTMLLISLGRRLGILALCVLSVAPMTAEIIPADRLTTWQGNVGVPGGIPDRTSIGATVDASKYGNGTTDATAAINAAVAACSTNQVAYLPPGTYLINSRILQQTKNNYSIRGAGQGQTIIKASGDFEVIHFGSADWPYPIIGVPITSGATKGSTVLTLGNTSSFAVGKLVHITQTNLSYVLGYASAQKVTFLVTAKTSTTVTLNHPLPCDFTASAILVSYSTTPVTGVGLESLTIDCNNHTGPGVYAEQAWGCWIKDVEIKQSASKQMLLVVFNQGEIRHCYTHDTYTTSGPNHEGIDLYNNCSWNLVEDNICENGGFPQIIMGDGGGGISCNVVAYNFCKNTVTGTTIAGADISFNHGPHNSFNLAEGNIVGSGISSDGYFGSSSHNTIFRNWAAAKPYTAGIPVPYTIITGLRAIQLNRMSNYYNVVGNVLGDSSFSTVPGVGNYDTETNNYPEMQLIYQVGYPNLGNNGYTGTRAATTPPAYTPPESFPLEYQQLDANVKNTIIRHGNYDYFTKTLIWDPGIADHNLPNSYYLAAKPSWFGNLTWPAIDPASPPGAFSDTNIARIPAGYRYVNGVDPPGGDTPGAPTGLQVIP